MIPNNSKTTKSICWEFSNILSSIYYCNLTNLTKFSFRVPFTFLVMATDIKILEAIDNKKSLDVGHEKGEAPLVANNDWRAKKASCKTIQYKPDNLTLTYLCLLDNSHHCSVHMPLTICVKLPL